MSLLTRNSASSQEIVRFIRFFFFIWSSRWNWLAVKHEQVWSSRCSLFTFWKFNFFLVGVDLFFLIYWYDTMRMWINEELFACLYALIENNQSKSRTFFKTKMTKWHRNNYKIRVVWLINPVSAMREILGIEEICESFYFFRLFKWFKLIWRVN